MVTAETEGMGYKIPYLINLINLSELLASFFDKILCVVTV